MTVERFKIAALPVDVSKLLTNSPLGGALAGGALGGLTSLVSGDDHPLRDVAMGAGAGALHGRLGQRANLIEQQGGELTQRMSDIERAMAARQAAPSAPAPSSPGVMDRLSRLTSIFKGGSLSSVFPAVAGPAIGGYAGFNLGRRYLNNPELGALLGTLTMGTAGKLLGEKAEETAAPSVPPGAPYALDATSQDIPPWALQGAQMLQPTLKQSEHVEREPVSDILKGEIPGYSVVEQGVKHGPGAAARTFGGMAGGGLLGGGLGALGGMGLEKLLGRHITVPGVGMSLPDLLASVGGTIGATKGLRYMKA
jgi:hypothetical protein